MMFLFRWVKWTTVSHWLQWFKISSLTIRVSFTSRFQLVNLVQFCRTFLLILMMSSTLWFSTYSRWTCQEIWDEGTHTWMNHSYQRDGVCGCLICVFFRITSPFLISPDRSMCCLYGLHDFNSVHYQCGLTSIVLRFWLHYSRLITISYADATLVDELEIMLSTCHSTCIQQ